MKARARTIIDRAEAEAKGWVPEYARGENELWTVKMVKRRLVDAHQLLNRIGSRVGPASIKAHWPEYQKLVKEGDYPPEKPKTSPYAGRLTVAQMEMVFGLRNPPGPADNWLAGPLLDLPREREKLMAWVQAELRGEHFKDLCERKRWALSSSKRHRDTAAGLIAHRLNMIGLEVW